MPSSLRVTSIHDEAVTLAWNRPEPDGGLPVRAYVVEKRDAFRGGWSVAGRTDAHTHALRGENLRTGSSYYFRVSAENDVGVGKACETPSAVEIKRLFGKNISFNPLLFALLPS